MLEGACSYDPSSKQVTDIEIRDWNESRTTKFGGGRGKHSALDLKKLERQIDPRWVRQLF
jgi:hypothetical protein